MATICATAGCGKKVMQTKGRGRPAKYCATCKKNTNRSVIRNTPGTKRSLRSLQTTVKRLARDIAALEQHVQALTQK